MQDVIHLSRDPVKLLIWGLIAGFLVWVGLHITTTVLIFSLAGLIAYLVSTPIRWLSRLYLPGTKRRIPWALATFIVYLLILGALALLFFILIPLVISEVNMLTSSMPDYLNRVENKLGELRAWYHDLHISPAMQDNIIKYGKSFLKKTGPTFSAIARNVASGILKVFTAVLIFSAALLFSLYIVLDEKNIKQHAYDMFPTSWRKDTEELFHNMGGVVGAYVRGQMVLSCLVGIASYAGLLVMSALGVRYEYSLLTALSIAMLYPIPFIGVWLPRLAAPVLAYLQTGQWSAALWTLIVLSGIGLIVDNFALPVIMGKGIGISPLMVLVVIFAGGELFGIWGLILSIPAAAVIRLIFFYIQKHVTI